MPKIDACPICDAPSAPGFAPFCGQGCRDRDLLRWLGEDYRLPAHPADPAGAPDGLDADGLDRAGPPR